MILVLVETGTQGVEALSAEALTFVRGIASGAPVHAVVVGAHPAGTLDQLAEQGVAEVHHVDDARMESFAAAAWAGSLAGIVTATAPDALVAAASPRGNEVLAHLAARLAVPMAAGCVAVEPGDPWTATRQLMGGAALERLRLDGPLRLLTMASHAVVAEPATARSTPSVHRVAPELTDADLVARVRSVEADASGGADLAGARVVVGGGRGAGGPDGFGALLELADLLGGTLGVSRVVTSQGWRPHHEQVGQTGTKIAPDLYVACGISGAIQHWAGCQSSKNILAINTDADAPMVTRADYAVIGDLHEVVPAVNAEIRRRRG